MPEGEGTYGKQVGRPPEEDTDGMPMKESAFKMRSGNATPFKQMGSSPVKQEKHFLERKPTIPEVDAEVPPPSSGKEGTVEPEKEGFTEGIKKGVNKGLERGLGPGMNIMEKRKEERGE